nr:DUF2933 domain-containing protein [Hyphomicrobium sp.]
MHPHNQNNDGQAATAQRSFWRSRAFLVFLAFAAMAAVLLWSEHRAHFLGVLPFLFIFACPLLHIFGGHDSHGLHGGHRSDKKGERS